MISPETFVFLGSHMCLWAWNTDYGVLKGPRGAHSWLRISLLALVFVGLEYGLQNTESLSVLRIL